MEASYTPQLSYGYYSPYIASVLDIARLMDSFRTAQLQYIPALAAPRRRGPRPHAEHRPVLSQSSVGAGGGGFRRSKNLNCRLACRESQGHVLRGEKLLGAAGGRRTADISTGYAHDMTLELLRCRWQERDLPALADAVQGGYVVDTSPLRALSMGDSVTAALRGYWGFAPYSGPSFALMNHTPSAGNRRGGR